MISIPELLLPAGNLDKLKTAFLFGADAVYCGVPRFSLRARENEFKMETLKDAVQYVHSLNKKLYFTINILPRNSKIASFPKYLSEMAELKPDAMIMADPGLIGIVREMHPEIPIHISVQANTMNYASVKFWKKIGATRIILSREVSIQEVKEIKQAVPDMELEVFVHGSICIAHSGRCFLSNYFKNRDANQGICNNACRDQYKVFVTNPRQNDEPMEMVEDSDGTYLMNSKDLRAIEFLEDIISAGVDSIKVEGRTKGEYYVAMVARTYRKALDNIRNGQKFDRTLLAELDKVASRKYFSGFLTRGMEDRVLEEELTFQNYEEGTSRSQTQTFAGKVIRYNLESKLATIIVKNKIQKQDKIEVFSPDQDQSRNFEITSIKHKNKEIDVVSGGIGEVDIWTPFEIAENSFLSRIHHE